MRFVVILPCILMAASVRYCSASVITFESGATGAVNVNPLQPYSEAGYTFTPSNGSSAIFGPGSGILPGDDTSVFAFDPTNTITLTGPIPFDLKSALIGRSNYGAKPGNLNLTVTGDVVGGPAVTRTFSDLSVGTEEVIDFKNVRSVTFRATNAAAIDDISVVSTVPEPSVISLVGGVFLLAAICVCMRHQTVQR